MKQAITQQDHGVRKKNAGARGSGRKKLRIVNKKKLFKRKSKKRRARFLTEDGAGKKGV